MLPPCPESAPTPYAVETLARLPVADAVLSLWAHVLQTPFLDEIYQRHRGRSFESLLSFPTIVELVADALLRHHGSGRQACAHADAQEHLPTSPQAFYRKLGRLPLALSLGFLEEVSARLLPLLPPTKAQADLPPCLDAMTVVIGDGKTIKKVAKRLLPARGVAGKVYGGKLLVSFLPAYGLVTALAADPDGEANETTLVPELLRRVGRRITGTCLWVLDRGFCDLVQIERVLNRELNRDDHVLIRYNRKVSFVADPERPAQQTTDAQGRSVVEEWGWLGAASNAGRRYLRRITLHRPGTEAIRVVTDLVDAAAYPASDLLSVYRTRWRIEHVFQQITEVFTLSRLIGSTPEATVFQASFCLVLYDLLQVLRPWAALAAPLPGPVPPTVTLAPVTLAPVTLAPVTLAPVTLAPEQLSTEQLFTDVCEELTALSRLLPVAEIVGLFRGVRSAEQLCFHLRECLGRGWTERWRKAVNTKPRPQTPKKKGRSQHTSMHRLREKHRHKQTARGGTS